MAVVKDLNIWGCAPGSRFLVACPTNAREELVFRIISGMTEELKDRTSLNTSSITTMDIIADDDPNRFSDLYNLCVKLVTAAGKKSHFEGLLLLNISALVSPRADEPRLKALGELLSMKNGLASRCITVLYGPSGEKELLTCADELDQDGKLSVIFHERTGKPTLFELLKSTGLCCVSKESEQMLEAVLAEMEMYEHFNVEKFIRNLGDEQGKISKTAITAMLNDPWSCINRAKKADKIHVKEASDRRLGF